MASNRRTAEPRSSSDIIGALSDALAQRRIVLAMTSEFGKIAAGIDDTPVTTFVTAAVGDWRAVEQSGKKTSHIPLASKDSVATFIVDEVARLLVGCSDS